LTKNNIRKRILFNFMFLFMRWLLLILGFILIRKAMKKLTFPVQGKSLKDMTSDFGPRGADFHNGIDIGAPSGTPILAADDGTIENVWTGGGGGLQIIINHGSGLKTGYAHLSAALVKVGQKVSAGDQIGKVGSSGFSTGPHLHFVVSENNIALDPKKYL
jgi:murein DD-endopeptidase MepM/ murein hydrolase activator NlpD